MSAQDVRAHFLGQAKACDALGSPFTAKLCRALAAVLDESTITGRAVLGWPGDAQADAVSLRTCGALHALVLAGTDRRLACIYPPNEAGEDEIATVLPDVLARWDEKLSAGLSSAPQTNEIARSALLLPGFLTIARETGLPLDLNEIGASAGLNLLFDRFHYRYGDAEWGHPASPVRLEPEVLGNAVPLDGTLVVHRRGGCDIAPVDILDEAARRRLRSYVWPDQPLRMERLDAALSLGVQFPPVLERMDAAAFVGKALEARTRQLLNDIELDPAVYLDRLPSELSGGQKQRVGIARALAADPQLVICDEVTSSLDQLVAESMLKLLVRLQRERDLTYMFITHDIATVRAIADEVVVMKEGVVVESGPKDEIFRPPHHPYTELLLSSVPEMDPDWLSRLTARNENTTV